MTTKQALIELADLGRQLAALTNSLRHSEELRQIKRKRRRGSERRAADAKRITFAEIDTLPRRQGQVLEALLDGMSEKQIAFKLGLSPHTVHVYVKSLHKRYDVNARSELLSLFISRSAPAAQEPIRPTVVERTKVTASRRPLRY